MKNKKLTIKQLLKDGENRLLKNKITSARLDAEVILYSLLNKSKEWLYTNLNTKIVQALSNKFNFLIRKRAKHFPVAYITNQKEFFGLNFYVNENVLIPRPETELLVEHIIALLTPDDFKTSGATIADIGTGSGCVAISLAKKLPKANIIATDISKKALAAAKKNAKRHGVSSRIKFCFGDLLKPIQNKKIDVIAANLPYLDSNMKNLLRSSDSKALKFEPRATLSGGRDGLNLYRKLFKQIAELKRPPRFVLIEIGHQQTREIKKNIEQTLPRARIHVLKDLAGLNRVIEILLPHKQIRQIT